MGRTLRLLGAALASFGLLTVGPGAANACACGAAIADEKFERVEETALVELSGGHEAITLNMAARTEATSAAFIMPVPARAEFELADGGIFAELDEVTKPRVVYREVERQPGEAGGAPPAGDGVEVTDHVTVGPYEVAQLTGDNTDAVTAWLAEHDFTLPDDLARHLTPYLREGWSVVAVHLTPDEAETLDGGLPPMRMSFPTDEPVYPMRLSAAADHTQPLRLYVLADHRVDAGNPTPSVRGPEPTFAGRLTRADVAKHPALSDLVDRPRFLTRFDARLDPAHITDDIRLTRADTDEEYRDEVTRIRYVDTAPTPQHAAPRHASPPATVADDETHDLRLISGAAAGVAAVTAGAAVFVAARRRSRHR